MLLINGGKEYCGGTSVFCLEYFVDLFSYLFSRLFERMSVFVCARGSRPRGVQGGAETWRSVDSFPPRCETSSGGPWVAVGGGWVRLGWVSLSRSGRLGMYERQRVLAIRFEVYDSRSELVS